MFADIEQKILERLREKLGGAITVEPLREIERVPELRQRAPAAWVIYDGIRLGDAPANIPHVQQVILDFYVVVAAKSARGNGEGNDARDEAGILSQGVVEALLGFHVGGGKHLRLNESPGPEYDAGYCHLPLAFSCAATFKGQP